MSKTLWEGSGEYASGMYAHAFWGGTTGPRIQFPCDNAQRFVSLDAAEVRELANALCAWLEDVAKGGPAFGAGGAWPLRRHPRSMPSLEDVTRADIRARNEAELEGSGR